MQKLSALQYLFVSEMTYNVSMGTLNPTIPYLSAAITCDIRLCLLVVTMYQLNVVRTMWFVCHVTQSKVKSMCKA